MNAKLNQKQLVDLLCSNAGLKKREAEAFIDAFFGVVEEQLLKGEQVKIKGLGVFKTIIVDERESVNVNTGERIKIESYTKISFTPDSDLKELINKPFAAFEPMVISDFQAAMIESSVDSEVVIETETEEQLSGTEDVVEVAEETISEQESVKIAEEQAPAGEPEPVEEPEPAGEPEPIEEPVSTTTISSELIDNKNVISKSKRNALRVLVWIFSLVLVVLLALYMLYPVIIQQYMKWQYNSLKSDDNTEIVVEKVQDNIAESVTEDVNEQTDDALIIPFVSATDVTGVGYYLKPFELVYEDARKDLADFTISDTVNYEITGTMVEHTLKKNEILTVLSEKYYGTKKLWPYIAKYNNFKDFNKLHPGTKVLIPKLKNK